MLYQDRRRNLLVSYLLVENKDLLSKAEINLDSDSYLRGFNLSYLIACATVDPLNVLISNFVHPFILSVIVDFCG
jgi:hypothetical protein